MNKIPEATIEAIEEATYIEKQPIEPVKPILTLETTLGTIRIL
jgi:hypothetical protein